MNRLLFVLLYLLVAALTTEHAAVAQTANKQLPTAVVHLRQGLPKNLATVFLAETSGGKGRVFDINVPGLTPHDIVAQRETASARTWFIARLQNPSLLGSTLKLPTTSHEVDRVVSIRVAEGGLQVLDAGRPVLFYVTTPQSHQGNFIRNGFVHPLRGLAGEELTQVFPVDHRHHHGVFWAWHQLWVGDQRAGDPWVTDDFLAELKEARVIDQGPVFAAMQSRLHWTSPKIVDGNGKPRAIIEETTTIRVFHATETTQLVDFEIQLKPLLDDVRLGGAENDRGYSGFTVRVPPPREMKILTESDALAGDAVGTQSRWADVTGKFSDGEQLTGIAILSHRSLPEFPPRWLLRFYGMQNVVYPGRNPIRLSVKSPLVLRHRLMIHRGDAKEARVADQQRVYELLF
ncbi:MAG: PmoA family protein [Pirellulaceae bacterium]|jgi:hypothetical protein|nr:PmoA family protein [Pirellulaceae bacterium]HJN07917.1 DUF6807 family protein [Pirellulaceae bacterium]